MKRKDEIKEILKYLLGETEEAINKKQYSEDTGEIIKSCRGVLEKADTIKTYIKEYETILKNENKG